MRARIGPGCCRRRYTRPGLLHRHRDRCWPKLVGSLQGAWKTRTRTPGVARASQLASRGDAWSFPLQPVGRWAATQPSCGVSNCDAPARDALLWYDVRLPQREEEVNL